MAFIYEELEAALDDYFARKTKDEILQDLIDTDCLKFFTKDKYLREYGYIYGVVSHYSCDGYGFIISEDNHKYFVFWKNILIKGFKSLNKNEKVKFKTKQSIRGIEAVEVEVIPDDFELNFLLKDEEYINE